MADLRFETKLKEIPVILVVDGVDKNYKVKELTGPQRASYNNSFNVKMGFGKDGKPEMMGDGVQIPSACDFVALCLYDSEDKLAPKEFVDLLPDRVINALQKEGMELSGMDAEALKTAKNELEESNSSGSE